MQELEELLEMFSSPYHWFVETKAWYGKVFRGEPQDRSLIGVTGPSPVAKNPHGPAME